MRVQPLEHLRAAGDPERQGCDVGRRSASGMGTKRVDRARVVARAMKARDQAMIRGSISAIVRVPHRRMVRASSSVRISSARRAPASPAADAP